MKKVVSTYLSIYLSRQKDEKDEKHDGLKDVKDVELHQLQ